MILAYNICHVKNLFQIRFCIRSLFSFYTSMIASALNISTFENHRQSEFFEKKSLEERTKGGPSFRNPFFSLCFLHFLLEFWLDKHSFIKWFCYFSTYKTRIGDLKIREMFSEKKIGRLTNFRLKLVCKFLI